MPDVTLEHRDGLTATTRAGRYCIGKATGIGTPPLFLSEDELRWLVHTAGPAMLADAPAALAAVTSPATAVHVAPDELPGLDGESEPCAPVGVYSEPHAPEPAPILF